MYILYDIMKQIWYDSYEISFKIIIKEGKSDHYFSCFYFGNKKLEKNVQHVACLYEQYIEKTCVSF